MTISSIVLVCCWMFCVSMTFAAGKCSKPTNVLMSDCDDECDVACIYYHRKGDRSPCGESSDAACRIGPAYPGCEYQCKYPFSKSEDSKNALPYKVFIIKNGTDPNVKIEYQMNLDYSHHIELTFPQDITDWELRGDSPSDQVLDVNLSYDMFRHATGLRRISIVNINVSIKDLVQNLPQEMVSIITSNCDIDEIPESLGRFKNLTHLSMDRNPLQRLPKLDLPSIQTLDLSYANMTSFEGNFPLLETLNLRHNILESIPPALVDLKNLEGLYLDGNSFPDRNVSSAVFDVLNRTLGTSGYFKESSEDCKNEHRKAFVAEDLALCVEPDDSSLSPSDIGSRSPSDIGSRSPSDIGSSDASSSSGSTDDTTLLPLYIAIPTVIAFVIAGFVLHQKYRHHKTPDVSAPSSQTPTVGVPETPVAAFHEYDKVMNSIWDDPLLRNYELNHKKIRQVSRLGVGAYGEVWLVDYCGNQYASKRLIKSKAEAEAIQHFIAETKLIATLEHPHILAFIGAAFTKRADFQAIYEYMERGDLRSYLTCTNVHRQWNEEKIQIATDIADSLIYLHSLSTPVMHRDLKSRNVLLSENMTAKIGDFGTARARDLDCTLTTKGVGTIRWIAPEIIRGEHEYDESSDIYSFGAILIELDTHELPYEDLVAFDGKQFKMVSMAPKIANGTIKPSFSSSCPASIRLVGLACLDMDPTKRPTAACVHYALTLILRSEMLLDLDTVRHSLGISFVETESAMN